MFGNYILYTNDHTLGYKTSLNKLKRLIPYQASFTIQQYEIRNQLQKEIGNITNM